MEQTRCSLNQTHAATLCCSCKIPNVFTCLPCLPKHIEAEGRHQLEPLRESRDTVTTTSADLGNCEHCHSPSVSLCCCRFPVVELCEKCRASHVANDPESVHHFISVTQKDKVQTKEDVLTVKQRQMALSIAEAKVKANESEVQRCEELYQKRYKELKQLLTDFRSSQLEPLKKRKTLLEAHLNEDTATLHPHLLDGAGAKGVEALVQEYMKSHDPKVLEVFRYEQRKADIDCASAFGIRWESRLTPTGEVMEEFSTAMDDEQMREVFEAADSLLELQDEERYIKEVVNRLKQKMDSFQSEAEIRPLVESARLRYYYQLHTCSQAKSQTLLELLPELEDLSSRKYEDWKQKATLLFRKKVKSCNESLSAKYQASLMESLEAAIDTRLKAKKLEEENLLIEAQISEIEHAEEPPRHKHNRKGPKLDRKPPGRRKNGFHLFSQQCRKDGVMLTESDKDGKQGAYFKMMSKMWKELSQQEQDMWKTKARRQRSEEHSPASPQSSESRRDSVDSSDTVRSSSVNGKS